VSYRCQLCREVVPRSKPRLLHVTYKFVPHKQIEREIPVCEGCKRQLDRGASLHELVTPQVVITPPKPLPSTSAPPLTKVVTRPVRFSSIEL
jgi:hypothetical protein